MKRIPFIAVAALAVALFSCDKEDVSPVDPQQLEWNISYEGYKTVLVHPVNTDEFFSEIKDVEVFQITAPKNTLFFPIVLTDSCAQELSGGKNKSQMSDRIVGTMLEYVDSADFKKYYTGYNADTLCLVEFFDGDYVAYVFELDSTLTPTGQYASCPFTKTGSSLGSYGISNLERQPDWNITFKGNAFYSADEDSLLLASVEVAASGIRYYDVYEFSEIALWNSCQGSYEIMIGYLQSERKKMLEEGNSIDEILFSAQMPLDTLEINSVGANSTVYIMEFDDQANFTGRYNAIDVNLPDFE